MSRPGNQWWGAMGSLAERLRWDSDSVPLRRIIVHLHRLGRSPCGREEMETLACDELERAGRFRFAGDRQRWMAGRVWIRRTLGAHLGMRASTIVFALGTRGKPRVVGAPPGFDCNWSHSGDRLALALSEAGPVGVDLELPHADFPTLEVARQFFTRSETAALEQAVTKDRMFLGVWTAKEALMKATGVGALLSPGSIEVRLAHDRPVAYQSHPEWQLTHRRDDAGMLTVAWRAATRATVVVESSQGSLFVGEPP